jgi:hypothetical protein
VAATYIHTCYRVLDPGRSEDFYVNKLGPYSEISYADRVACFTNG